MKESADFAKEFLKKHPEVERIELFFVDINGIARGKWANPDTLIKAFSGNFRLPISSYVSDIWGEGAVIDGLGTHAGDIDGLCIPVAHSVGSINWLNRPAAQCLLSMNELDGTAFYADPRQVLKNVLDRFEADGLRPVIALELEFYLVDKKLSPNGHPKLPVIPGSNQRYSETQLLDVHQYQDLDAVFTAINDACRELNIPAESIIKEDSPGQFEFNLQHQKDALLAADQAFILKRIIKGCALQHGLCATFMAKPFSEWSGSGMHMHASVIDQDNNNIFNQHEGQPVAAYAHAIAGLLQASPDLMAFFAPHSNSYRRFGDRNSLAPNTLSWGQENRTALIRLPMADAANYRIEYRLPGADANPYLLAAGILAGIHHGLSRQLDLPDETVGNAHQQHPHELDISWQQAVNNASESEIIKDYFGERFQQSFQIIKQGEIDRFARTVTDFEYHSYLRYV